MHDPGAAHGIIAHRSRFWKIIQDPVSKRPFPRFPGHSMHQEAGWLIENYDIFILIYKRDVHSFIITYYFRKIKPPMDFGGKLPMKNKLYIWYNSLLSSFVTAYLLLMRISLNEASARAASRRMRAITPKSTKIVICVRGFVARNDATIYFRTSQ